MPKKYILIEDIVDEVAVQKDNIRANYMEPTVVFVSNDLYQIIKKSDEWKNNRFMGLQLLLASDPLSRLKHYIMVVR